MRRFAIALFLLVGGYALAPAAPPAAPAPAEPRYIDDDATYEQFFDKLGELAKAGKPLAHDKLTAKLKPRAAGVTPAKPGARSLAPEDVYKAAAPSVFVVGSTYPDKDGKWQTGTYATAWVLAADGVLVTNWHVFEDLKDDEVFGAADHTGAVYPLTDFLGGDKTADVAVFRIAAADLKPLPVAPAHAEIGSWVGVIGHPGDLFYLYTQGAVSRYSTNTNDDKKVEKWMGITAEFASGSSGSPVLNKYGAVVGMAAMTLSLDANDDPRDDPKKEGPKKDEPKMDEPKKGEPKKDGRRPALAIKKLPVRRDEPKDEKKGDKPKDPPKPGDNQKGSPQQMVVRMAVPGPELRKWIGK